MGASGSKDLTVGKTMPEATAVLARRLEKCRAAAADASLKPKLALRAREKALGLLRLVSAWDGSPGSRGSLPLPPLLDAACRAVWVLEECAEEAELVLNTVLPRIQSLAERAHGAKSLQNAAVLALLTQRAYAADDFAQIVRWGQPASALLLELRGERYSVPEAQRKGFMDSWESAPSLHLCEEGHCDMLYYLVYAHANLAGQASLAHAAADRYLALVDTIWGHVRAWRPPPPLPPQNCRPHPPETPPPAHKNCTQNAGPSKHRLRPVRENARVERRGRRAVARVHAVRV